MSTSKSGLRERVSRSSSETDSSPPPSFFSKGNTDQTLTYDESLIQVPWQTDNVFIRSGYRKYCKTFGEAAYSVFGYLHNETVNIHSHLWGAIFYLILIPLHFSQHLFESHRDPYSHFLPFLPRAAPLDPLANPRPQTLHDFLALSIFLVSAVVCLSFSAWFHAFQCRDKVICDKAHKGDYVGIVVLIVGSFWPSIYHGFRGQPFWQVFYIGMSTTLGILAAWTVLAPGRGTGEQIWIRTTVFISLGLSAVFPVCHVILIRGLAMARTDIGFDYLVGGGACYIFGAVLYAGRIPEKLSPGTFDYFFSSHQIFHCFVLAGSFCHYRGILNMSLH